MLPRLTTVGLDKKPRLEPYSTQDASIWHLLLIFNTDRLEMKIAEDFDAFVAIVEAGNISEAARVLGTPRATLSRQLGRLEARLGARLLHRSTRRMVPTAAGETLYGRARGLLESAKAAVESVQRLDDVPRGPLRVSGPPMGTPVLGELVADYLAEFPAVTVELQTTTRHVDLAGEHVDVALRAGVIEEPSLIVRPLARVRLMAVASPDYLARCGTPGAVSELAQHVCIRGFDRGTRPGTTWPLGSGGTTPIRGPFVSNDLAAIKGAAVRGLGIALLPRLLIDDELESGALSLVLPETVGQQISMCLVWLEREFIDPKVRAFVDLAARWAADGRLGT
ncbi:MAG: LysR family transcriptional regulator [Nannocystaceae bacterium]|nr:LysR family transcriptional regulator [Nannocystaceae bacterium]